MTQENYRAKAGSLPHLNSRRELTLLRSPIKTLSYFLRSSIDGIWFSLKWISAHPVTLFLGLPLLLLYATIKFLGLYEDGISEVEQAFEFIIWWVGLGILSSIGFGSGMHSGLLFLFPHILKICLAAERCGNLDFDLRADMWWRSDGFHCSQETSPNRTEPSFLDIYMKSLTASILWGVGTAVGEIPPYLLSYQAAKAGRKTFEAEHMLQIHDSSSNMVFESTKSFWSNITAGMTKMIQRIQSWMLRFIEARGFWGIFLLSAYPNAAFDLCGICCGHFMMPFWEFFGATVMGKGFVKVAGQTAFFVALFRKASREHILSMLENSWLSSIYIHGKWNGAYVLHSLRATIDAGIDSFQADVIHRSAKSSQGPTSFIELLHSLSFRSILDWKRIKAYWSKPFSSPWQTLVAVMVIFFVKSVIEQIAQARAAEEEADRGEKKKE